MNDDHVLHDTLQQLQTEVTSTPSIVDDVMQRIEQKPMPVRCGRFNRTKVIAACTAAAACLAVAIGIWIGADDREPVKVASTGGAVAESELAAGLQGIVEQTDNDATGLNLGIVKPENSMPDDAHALVAGLDALGFVAGNVPESRGNNPPVPEAHLHGFVPEAHARGLQGTSPGVLPLLPPWTRHGAMHHGRDPMSIQVAKASLIARCKIVEILEESNSGFAGWGLCKCKVERVIYGKLPGKQIGAYLNYTHSPVGTSHVFFLFTIPPEANAEVKYFVSGGVDADEMHEFEQEVVEIVERGDHLTPPNLSSYHLGMYIRASSRIVRAKLRKVGTSAAEWEVLDELEFQPLSEAEAKGMNVADAVGTQGSHDGKPVERAAQPRPTEPGVVRVGLGTWRLRAETVARFRAYRDAKRACTEEEIQKQFDRLVTAELKPGTEAILLLRAPKGADTYNLVGNFLPDPKDPGRVDKAWKALTKTIASDEYKDTSIIYH